MTVLESIQKKLLYQARDLYRTATVPLRSEPDYMVIGVQKSGTTTLFDMLSLHPEVRNPRKKELHYFDAYDDHSNLWYRSQFPLKGKYISGEATPAYLFYPQVDERIKEAFPDCKFIVLLREPGSRAYSHFQMTCRNGFETLPFEEALKAEEQRLAEIRRHMKQNPRQHSRKLLVYSYKSRGKYAEQLERWFKLFKREQFLILTFDDFLASPGVTMSQICDFLGISNWEGFTQKKSNTFKYDKMSHEARTMLDDYFLEHNKQLAALLERDLPW